MTPREKIKYVKDQINELAEISSKDSPLYLQLYTLTEYELLQYSYHFLWQQKSKGITTITLPAA